MMRLLQQGIVGVVLLVVGLVAVDQMGDAFQSRGDRTPPGSRSDVVLELAAQRYQGSLDSGAEVLVATCAGRIHNDLLDDPGVVGDGDGRYQFTVEPSLGPNSEVKLVGCLEDMTIDRLSGNVVSIEHRDPPDDDSGDEESAEHPS